MKIKQLEILGFKSFPEKTVIEFKTGITGIVGPNGCGKSNIVDAIRWVMGEMSAKHLRGKSMEDVIFVGTQNRQATGMAEVTMILSNEDGRAPAAFANFSEISVTRRLYRSGESEYAINKVPCRLKDIYDLFLGTGVGTKAYSIIEQGKIGQIITSKPEDRRSIIEEAAGISKFKSRKEAALRKIEATHGNLLRLADILKELQRQIQSMERQARKAERYRELSTHLKEVELHLRSHDYLNCSQKLEAVEVGLKQIQEQETVLTAEVSGKDAQVEQDRLSLIEKERELQTLQEWVYERNNALQLQQASIDYKTREIEGLTQKNEKLVQDIESIKGRLQNIDQSINESEEKQLGYDLEIGSLQEGHDLQRQQLEEILLSEKEISQKFEELNQEWMQVLQALTEKGGRKESLGRRKVDLAGRIGKDQGEIDELDKLLTTQKGKLNHIQSELGEVKQYKLGLVQQSDHVLSTIQQERDAAKNYENELISLKETLALKKSRLASLEDLEKSFEGYKEGVRNVMLKRAHDPQNSIYGTVADLVETESSYELAVGAALGEKLQYVVVKSQEAGVDALQYLKTESMGRLSCIPVEVRSTAAQEHGSLVQEEGVLGPLHHFVKMRENYDGIRQYLFSNTYLVENLNRALEIWNNNGNKKTLVTLDGEMVDPFGVVSGGSRDAGAQSFLEKKREIKELRHLILELEAKIRDTQAHFEHLQERVKMLESSLEALKKDSHSEELKIVHQEQDLSHIKSEIQRLVERRDKLSLEIAAAMSEESEITSELDQLEVSLKESQSRKTALQSELDQARQQQTDLKIQIDSLRHQSFEKQNHLNISKEKKGNLEREVQRMLEEKGALNRVLEEDRASITQANSHISQLKEEIEQARNQVTSLVSELREKEGHALQMKEQVSGLQNSIQLFEAQLKRQRVELEALRQGLQERLLQLGEGRTQIQLLKQQILERYHVDLGEIAPQFFEKPLDGEKQKVEVQELREKIEKLGSVHLGALEEHEELKKRHDFIQHQHQDLTQSLESLQRALQRVNRTTKKRFQETFEAVNQVFQEVFPKLFKGGRAELILTNPEDVLESGLEIVAQPPGKKLQSVSLLSGGEKALTAVGLVFSIFMIKPSPFCLLDEVDAPLDDVNIDRFNDMVRSLVDRAQFILITHNKRTMEMADLLYGITMEQAGVSKLVSVELQR